MYIIGRRPNYYLPISEYIDRFGNPESELAYVVDAEKAIDIDTKEDYLACKFMLQKNKFMKIRSRDVKSYLKPRLAAKNFFPNQNEKNKIICVIKVENMGEIYKIGNLPSICHPIKECLRSNLFSNIILAGDASFIMYLSYWAGIDHIICKSGFRSDGLPNKELRTMIEEKISEQYTHMCVLDGMRPLIDCQMISGFLAEYAKANYCPTETISCPEVHPYWCKCIDRKSLVKAFDTPYRGMRQSLPELFVKNKAIVATQFSAMKRGIVKFRHFVRTPHQQVRLLSSLFELTKILANFEIKVRC
jgi:CMP-N-acetylneuraminic acid synthetase